MSIEKWREIESRGLVGQLSTEQKARYNEIKGRGLLGEKKKPEVQDADLSTLEPIEWSPDVTAGNKKGMPDLTSEQKQQAILDRREDSLEFGDTFGKDVVYGSSPFVMDADTISIDERRVRLGNIDANELAQTGGKEARDFLSSKVKDKKFSLEITGVGAYGRDIGTLTVQEENINELLVKTGNAVATDEVFKQLEEEAKAGKLGRFGIAGASDETPAEFRKRIEEQSPEEFKDTLMSSLLSAKEKITRAKSGDTIGIGEFITSALKDTPVYKRASDATKFLVEGLEEIRDEGPILIKGVMGEYEIRKPTGEEVIFNIENNKVFTEALPEEYIEGRKKLGPITAGERLFNYSKKEQFIPYSEFLGMNTEEAENEIIRKVALGEGSPQEKEMAQEIFLERVDIASRGYSKGAVLTSGIIDMTLFGVEMSTGGPLAKALGGTAKLLKIPRIVAPVTNLLSKAKGIKPIQAVLNSGAANVLKKFGLNAGEKVMAVKEGINYYQTTVLDDVFQVTDKGESILKSEYGKSKGMLMAKSAIAGPLRILIETHSAKLVGGVLAKATSKIKLPTGATKFYDRLTNNVAFKRIFANTDGKIGGAQFAANGVINEVFIENRAEDVLFTLFGLDSKDGISMDDMMEAAFPNFEQISMEVGITVGGMGVSHAGMAGINNLKGDMSKSQLTEWLELTSELEKDKLRVQVYDDFVASEGLTESVDTAINQDILNKKSSEDVLVQKILAESVVESDGLIESEEAPDVSEDAPDTLKEYLKDNGIEEDSNQLKVTVQEAKDTDGYNLALIKTIANKVREGSIARISPTLEFQLLNSSKKLAQMLRNKPKHLATIIADKGGITTKVARQLGVSVKDASKAGILNNKSTNTVEGVMKQVEEFVEINPAYNYTKDGVGYMLSESTKRPLYNDFDATEVMLLEKRLSDLREIETGLGLQLSKFDKGIENAIKAIDKVGAIASTEQGSLFDQANFEQIARDALGENANATIDLMKDALNIGAEKRVLNNALSDFSNATDLQRKAKLEANADLWVNTPYSQPSRWGSLKSNFIDASYRGMNAYRFGFLNKDTVVDTVGSKELFNVMRQYQFNAHMMDGKTKKISEGFNKKLQSLNEQDFKRADFYLKNNMTMQINAMAQEKGFSEELVEVRTMLDQLYQDAVDVGMSVDYMQSFFPRSVRINDMSAFLDTFIALSEKEQKDVRDGNLKVEAAEYSVLQRKLDAKNRDGLMTKEEQVEFINNAIASNYGIRLNIPGATKSRQIDMIENELMEFYNPSTMALLDYVSQMSEAITSRQMMVGQLPGAKPLISRIKYNRGRINTLNADIRALEGKEDDSSLKTLAGKERALNNAKNNLKGSQKELQNKSISSQVSGDIRVPLGELVLEMVKNGEVKPKNEKLLVDVLSSYFQRNSANPIAGAMRDIGLIGTLNDPINAISQLGDLSLAAYKAGTWNTMLGIVTPYNVKKEDIGIFNIAEEFDNKGGLSGLVDKTIKATGLNLLDGIGKNVLLNASLRKAQNMAKKDKGRLRDDLGTMFEANQVEGVIESLKKGEETDDVLFYLFNQLVDMQPVGVGQVPAAYEKGGFYPLLYGLRTFPLKMWDITVKDSLGKMKNKDTFGEGFSNLVRLQFLAGLFGMGKDWLVDLLLGRENPTLLESAIDNIIFFQMINKFHFDKAFSGQPNTGAGAAALGIVAPPIFNMMDAITKDIYDGIKTGKQPLDARSMKFLPTFGRLYYYHFGGGSKGKKKKSTLRK